MNNKIVTTKNIIEEELQRKFKEFEIIYDPLLEENAFSTVNLSFEDGAKVHADVNHLKEEVRWNDHATAIINSHITRIKQLKHTIDLNSSLVRSY